MDWKIEIKFDVFGTYSIVLPQHRVAKEIERLMETIRIYGGSDTISLKKLEPWKPH